MTTPASEVKEQAYRAAVKFRQMMPTLTAYARNISGNPRMRIEITSSGARTDGKTIYLTPPFEMGSNLQHVRNLCDKRDKSSLLIKCDACRVHEEVMVNVYHEIAHNAFGSFAEIPPHVVQDVALSALGSAKKSAYIEQTRKKLEQTGGYLTYMTAANIISPHLSTLSNVLDDIRINQRMFEARPGMKSMFVADEIRMAINGLQIVNPETGELIVRKYEEMPRDAQVCTALYWVGAGYGMDDIFTDEIVETLQDEELLDILRQTPSAPDMPVVLELSIRALIRLRELGYLIAPDEPDEPDEGGDGPSSASDGTQSGDSQPQDGAESDDHAPGDPRPTDDAPGPESPIPDPESDDETEGEQDGPDSDGHASGDEQDSTDSGDEGSSGGSGEDESEDEGSDDANEDSSSEAGAGGGDSDDEEDSDSESGGDSDGDGSESSGDGSSSDELSDDDGADGPEGHDSNEDDGTQGSNGGRDSSGPLDEGKSEPSDPEEIKKIVEIFLGHSQPDQDTPEMQEAVDELADAVEVQMKSAVNQAHYFDQPAVQLGGVLVHDNLKEHGKAWSIHNQSMYITEPEELTPPESIMGSALLKTRVTFSENKRARHQQDLKSGKVNVRVLGKRAHLNDDRLFRRKQIPGKRDYFVCIGLDISGSTMHGVRRDTIVQAAFAQAELLYRVGVKFAIYAHSGGFEADTSWADGDYYLEIFEVKTPDQPWDNKAKERLSTLVPYSANVDGHTLEFYRKVLDGRTETDRIIMYYTDGDMPYKNYQEELEVLQREIKTCKTRGYTLMAVGVGTDSPNEHGLDTVQIDTQDDLAKVVQHLDKRLIRKS